MTDDSSNPRLGARVLKEDYELFNKYLYRGQATLIIRTFTRSFAHKMSTPEGRSEVFQWLGGTGKLTLDPYQIDYSDGR